MSILYSAQCTLHQCFVYNVYKSSSNPLLLFCLLIYIHLYNLWSHRAGTVALICTARLSWPDLISSPLQSVRAKDYRGINRLLSYMNKDEGSEVNHCCQVFANFSASVTKLLSHIFCKNFVIVNFVICKLCYV
jgi:hypothetical protein